MKRKKKFKKPTTKRIVTGVAWYSPADWEQVKRAVPDPERLEDTYEAWESMATAAMAEFEAVGVRLERVPVQAQEWVAWCRQTGQAPDGGARSQFVAEKLRKRDLDKRC
jgi:hypothetical protein